MGRRSQFTEKDFIKIAKMRAKRVPVEKMAAEFKVDETTLYNVFKKPEIAQMIEHYTIERIGDVLDEHFVDGKADDRRLYLNYIRNWNPAQKIDAKLEADVTLSDLIKAENANGKK